MPEAAVVRRSALHEIWRGGEFGEQGAAGLSIAERRPLSIVQIAAWTDQAEGAVTAVAGSLGVTPDREPCRAAQAGDVTALWVGPDRWLLVEPEQRDLEALIRADVGPEFAAVTDQSHSRCVLRLTGPRVRDVLRKGTTLDLDAAYFKPGDVRTTALFHMNGLVHCIAEDSFDLYVARSFAWSFFEVLCHAMAEYGYRVVDD